MDGSPASAADMLLQRHRSSLQPSVATASAASTPTAAVRASVQQQRRAGDAPMAGPAGSAASDSELERMMQAARWGGGGRQQTPPVPMDVFPRMQQQPLSPVILPASEARQPDIVRHEEAELFDALGFRLRNNERDLKSVLLRSADRLAKIEQHTPRSAAGDLALPSEAAPAAATTPPLANPIAVEPAPMVADSAAAAPTAVAAASTWATPDGSTRGGRTPVNTPPPPTPTRADLASTSVVDKTGVTNASSRGGNNSQRGSGGIGSQVVNNGLGATGAKRGAAVAMESAAAVAMQMGLGSGMAMPAPVTDATTAATREGPVVTPTRLAGGGEGGGGTATAAGEPSVCLQRGSIGLSSSGSSLGSAATGGVVGGGGAKGGLGRGMKKAANSNNINGVLVTPPRLPRPLTEGMIVDAAIEGARWLAVDDRTWHQGKKFFDECTADCPNERNLNRRKLTPEQWREAKIKIIKESIAADPSLATSRHINRSAFPMDGWTPLHAAAAKGNLEFVKVLLDVPGVSAWSVDLQGRTALALAAAEGHLDLCLLLKERMEKESADTIVGVNAPVDLSGRTPLAWSVKAARQKRNKEVESHLFAAGDTSVCPATPAALRSGGGRTGTKGGGGETCRTGAGRGAAESIGDGLPCGYTEAPGFRIDMEDAICRHNPIPVIDPEAREAPPPSPTSMFGIFDGHGGKFTSTFCAERLVECLQATDGWKSGNRDLSRLCPAVMEAFVNLDDLLAKEIKMVVKELENPSDGKRFEARDCSGSTALVALVTPAHVIVANAGDSRAVLIMVAPDRASNGKVKTIKGKGGGNNRNANRMAIGASSSGSVKDKKGAAEAMAAALGLRLRGSKGTPGIEENERKAVADGLAAAGAAVGGAGGGGGGLNDSMRLEDQEDKGGDGDGEDDFEGADQIRELLEAMMLGEAKEGHGAGARGGGGGGRDESNVVVVAMSRDHTAMDDAERERVTKAGGKAFEVPYTEEDGTTSIVVRTAYDDQVEGQSVVPTRGFGDFYYKQKKGDDGKLLNPSLQVVTSHPEIMVHERGSSGKEELLLLACDGLWDVFDNQDAGEFLVSRLDVPLAEVTGEQLAVACDALVAECLRRSSQDNITAMAVSLGSGPPPLPSSVGGRVLFSNDQ